MRRAEGEEVVMSLEQGAAGSVTVSTEAQPGPLGGEAEGPRGREHFLRTTTRVTGEDGVLSVPVLWFY